MITGLDRDILLPAVPVEHTRPISLKFPVSHFSVLISHVHENEAVRVGPLDLRDDSRDRNRLVRIVFRAERVMRRSRCRPQCQSAGGCARPEYMFLHKSYLERQFTKSVFT